MASTPPSSDPFHGLNPAELMAAAAMPTDGGADTLPLTPRDLPSLAEIAAAFPDLEILDLIGHGGMSAVFRARQPKLDRIVALKVLPKSLAATPGFAERFTREGRVLARLSHPNIVAVHDFGESGGFCFLIMEYVDGVNLRQAMRAGRFTPEQALGIIPVMCEALQYAHSQGVLHRDIKPENILLDAKGRVKIADFGIAKILDENADGGMLLTQSGARLGTAPYMAPEQIEKPGSVDHRADIYSLGVVFYEMLTGELPLGRFAAPSEKAAVSGGMDEVVFRALAKERERRQQSAGEFKTQIEGATMAPGMRHARQASGAQMRALKLGGVVVGSIFVCANVIFLRHFFQVPQPDWPRTVLPWVLLNAGGFSLILNLCLWLRLVPINRIYGVQSPATLSNPRRWYEVNAFFGKQAFWWSFVVSCAGIAGFYQLPRHQDAYAWAALTLTLVGIAASVVSTLVWIHRHPVGGPEIKPNRLVRNLELVFPALVLAFFIKSFICAAYSIPTGNEPGVAKGSHWLASRLDTGFAPGDLVAYAHESGQTWLARVVAIEPKGLLLKRGGNAEKFSVPWDKIIGKMLFPYYSSDGAKGDAGAKQKSPASTSEPMDQGSATALEQQPELVCTRLKLNKDFWSGDFYSTTGVLLDDPLGQKSEMPPKFYESDAMSDVGEPCWMQLWFRHPDFDQRSEMSLTVTGLDGKPLPRERETMISAPGFSSEPGISVNTKAIVFSPGMKGRLPEAVRVVLSYCIGRRKITSKIPTSFSGGMHFGDGAIFSNLGESPQKQAFISWSVVGEKQRFFAVARPKSGSWIESSASGISGSTTSEGISHFSANAKFPLRLDEIEEFGLGHRPTRTVVFERVVIPPLSAEEDSIAVCGAVKTPSRMPWHHGMTLREAVMAAGGVTPSARADKCKLLREGMAVSLSRFTSFEHIQELDLRPGDQIIIPK